MCRTAAALAADLRRVLADRATRPGRVLLLVGTGDNGGDALYAGAELAAEGVEVTILPTGMRWHRDAAEAAANAGARFADPADAARLAAESDVVVDGILGTGASPGLRGAARDLVAAILPVLGPGGPAVVAVDLPSGIGPDDGAVPDPAVLPADVTVTFGAEKAGLLLAPGAALAGRVILVDLGLGPHLVGDPLVRLGS